MVLETDQYFYTQVGDDPAKYDYSEALLPAAREWNLARFRDAIAREMSPIVIDRGNGLNHETREYALEELLCSPEAASFDGLAPRRKRLLTSQGHA